MGEPVGLFLLARRFMLEIQGQRPVSVKGHLVAGQVDREAVQFVRVELVSLVIRPNYGAQALISSSRNQS
jgi:hypothetical protein